MNFHPRFALLASAALALTLSVAGCKSNTTPQTRQRLRSLRRISRLHLTAQHCRRPASTGQPAADQASAPASQQAAAPATPRPPAVVELARGDQHPRAARYRSRIEYFAARRFVSQQRLRTT